MPMKNKFLAAILTIALPVLPALAAGEPVRGQKNSHQGDRQDKKADKPAKPVMLPQPATTEPMPTSTQAVSATNRQTRLSVHFSVAFI